MKKVLRITLILLVATFMGLLIYDPSKYMKAISQGLMLFAVSVLPAMFPFFFFSKILTGLGVADNLSRITQKPMRRLFNAPDIGGYIYAISILSGYPIGAKMVTDCYAQCLIDESDCKTLIAFTSTSGPLFILGTIGSAMFHNTKIGIILLITHYIGALINGIIFKSRSTKTHAKQLQPLARNYDSLLSDAINGSIASVLAVGGYIAIFNMIIAALLECGVLSWFGALLGNIHIPPELTIGTLAGIIEVTRGTLLISQTSVSLQISVPVVAALVAFGGLSITLQSLTFLTKCKIKPRYYLLTKLSQAVITYALCTIACLVFI